MTNQPICFIDTETDGLHYGKQAWEVAIIRREHDEVGGLVETTMRALLPLPSMRTSDPYALEKGGFWERHPRGRELSGKAPLPGPGLDSPRKVAEVVFRMTFEAHFVGVNPAFDAEVLSTLLRGEGLIPRWDYHLEDLVAETVGYLRGWSRRADQDVYDDVVALPWRSEALAAAVGVEPAGDEERHTALGDARWAMRWHDALAGRLAAEAAA